MLATIAAYLPAFRGEFIWDDDDYVTQNQTLRSLDGLRRIWLEFGATRQYYPLVYSTFWVEYHLWGLNPFGYHAVNILLHGLAAGLLWRVLIRAGIPGAFWAAAAFALHPVQVESVAWITERKNVLSGVFYFAAALAYLRFLDARAQGLPSRGLNSAYLAALALFACALLSKSVTCSLPAALALLIWWRDEGLRSRDVVPLLPLFALGAALGLTTAWMENTHVGAGAPEWARPFTVRFITAGRAAWFYLGKLLWPHPLIFIYPKWSVDPRQWAQFLYPLSVLALLIALYGLRGRIGRGPLAAALFFWGTLLPALGFFNVYYALRYSPVADHFQYLACAGPFAVIAAGGARLARRCKGVLPPKAAAAIAAAPLIVCAALTWSQCAAYRNLESLWKDTLAKNPGAASAYLNLGAIHQARGEWRDAERCYRRAMELDAPDPKVHFNLGTVFLRQGDSDGAILQFRQALALQPDYPKCLVNLAEALRVKGALDQTIECLARAVALQPDYALARAYLGDALLRAGRAADAVVHLEEAVRLNPKDEASRQRLSDARRRVGG
jgi:tetratricopeptide (TPR) repeat protein